MCPQQSAAQPVQIVRQAAEAARSAAQSVDMAEVRDTIATQAVRAAEAARDAAQNVDVAEVRDTITGEVAKDYELVIDETRRRPLRSLIIAIGVGALIGTITDRIRRRRAESRQRTTPVGQAQAG